MDTFLVLYDCQVKPTCSVNCVSDTALKVEMLSDRNDIGSTYKVQLVMTYVRLILC